MACVPFAQHLGEGHHPVGVRQPVLDVCHAEHPREHPIGTVRQPDVEVPPPHRPRVELGERNGVAHENRRRAPRPPDAEDVAVHEIERAADLERAERLAEQQAGPSHVVQRVVPHQPRRRRRPSPRTVHRRQHTAPAVLHQFTRGERVVVAHVGDAGRRLFEERLRVDHVAHERIDVRQRTHQQHPERPIRHRRRLPDTGDHQG